MILLRCIERPGLERKDLYALYSQSRNNPPIDVVTVGPLVSVVTERTRANLLPTSVQANAASLQGFLYPRRSESGGWIACTTHAPYHVDHRMLAVVK